MSSLASSGRWKHREKVAWLEAMLDTTVVAYESHRNALENIYDRLARWQRASAEGCIHVSPAAVNELLKDINDVLEQCALRLQSMEELAAAAGSTAEEAHPATATAPPPSKTAHPKHCSRGMQPQPDDHSSANSLSARRIKEKPAPPPQVQKVASRSVSEPSSANYSCEVEEDVPLASTMTTESKRHLKSSSGQLYLPLSAACSRSSSVPPSASESANAALQPTFTSGISVAADPSNSPAQLDKTAQEEQPQRQQVVTDVQLTMAITVHESTPPQRARQDLASAESTPPNPQSLTGSQGSRAQPRNRTGVALTPWPIIDDRCKASDADRRLAEQSRRVAMLPSARLREAENHDELPAPQYRSYKETGRVLLPSPERRAMAAELEGRAAAVQNEKAKGTPHQFFGERGRNREEDFNGDSAGRYKASSASSVTSASRPSMSARGPQRSQPQPRQQMERAIKRNLGEEQGIPRPQGSPTAAEHRSTNPGSAGRANSCRSSLFEESQYAGSAPAATSEHRTAASVASRHSHTAPSHQQGSAGSRTPSPASNALRGDASSAAVEAVTLSSYASSSASHRPREPRGDDQANSDLRKQRSGAANTAVGQHMDASQAGSIGLVYTPTTTPQRDSGNGVTVAVQQQQNESTSQVPPDLPLPLQEPGKHRRLRTSAYRRASPKANDSSQMEHAVYRRRTFTPPLVRQPLRADVPETLQFMQKEDALLEKRRDRMLKEVHRGPCQLPDSADIDADAGTALPITIGPVGLLVENCSKADKGAAPAMTAVEEQLVTESNILRTQLEKMEMELTIAVLRHRERGNEQRYAQLRSRMTRVRKDLDRVEWELYTVRNIDRKSQSRPSAIGA
ncbi:hypothetical protein GH5_07986 [Leishmania sp. Ghana 2012 LV757]|uniref:hypothetical protein n=1 Tax=Leishmania sp. Ghana 2012 LV757 TaxID=2803181 RepID=UPI001B715AC6|nr:hypothetical protein GH5_07986 [Leishmania sp. Ghana 2012 LV757]